jgi:SAM-dependent methyltransferase
MTDHLGNEIFWAVHKDLPREAPGDDASTLRAFAMLKDLPARAAILDIGCGPGAQTLALARASQAKIVAVDTHQPFLDDLARRAMQAGVADQIQPLNMSMFDLAFEQKFDLLWSEGAIYIIGFEDGLRKWRSLLKPGGYVAVTEISWLKPDIPDEVARFWLEAYPAMATVEENLARLARAGYRSLGHFTIPESAWWDAYYHPMAARIMQLREMYRGNAAAQEILDIEHAEIELYRKYSDFYGYVFYVMKADR